MYNSYNTFHFSPHFLVNSAKTTDSFGFFFFSSSRQVCTKKAYADILPRGFPSFLPIFPTYKIYCSFAHKQHISKPVSKCKIKYPVNEQKHWLAIIVFLNGSWVFAVYVEPSLTKSCQHPTIDKCAIWRWQFCGCYYQIADLALEVTLRNSLIGIIA